LTGDAPSGGERDQDETAKAFAPARRRSAKIVPKSHPYSNGDMYAKRETYNMLKLQAFILLVEVLVTIANIIFYLLNLSK
jgi:hypothetical protein